MRELLDPPKYERRLRRVPIANHFLTAILQGGYPQDVRDIRTDLPDDAEVVHVTVDPTRDCVVAIVRSVEFDPVDPAEVIPVFEPQYVVLDTKP